MIRIKYFLYLLLAVFCLAACNKNTDEKATEKELEDLQKYLDANGYNKTANLNTLYIQSIQEGTGSDTAKNNDFVVFDYTATFVDGRVLETTDESKVDYTANDAQFYNDFVFAPYRTKLGTINMEGLRAGIAQMNEGDITEFVIPSRLAYHNDMTLIYRVELLDIIHGGDSAMIAYDSLLFLDVYTQMANGNNAYWLPLRTIFNPVYLHSESTIDTTMESTEVGDTLLVAYSQYYLRYSPSNTPIKQIVFSNAPAGDTLVYTPDNFVNGFATALKFLDYGDQAEVLVPSSNAYGSNALYHNIYNYTIIPEYSSLYYEIHVLDTLN